MKEAPAPAESTVEAAAEKEDPWTVEFTGYIRAQYSAIQNDPNFELVGRRDGFSLADVRLGFEGSQENGLGFKISIDAASSLPGGADPGVEIGTRLKDGYLYYEPFSLLRISIGQFKAPFDIEELTSTSRILFVQRSVGNEGLSSVDGSPVGGLSQGRQVGIRFDSEPYYFSGVDARQDEVPQGFGFSYALAATNGQDANLLLNDNDDSAYFGRVNLLWGELLRLGGAAFHNERLLGVEPDQLSETRNGWTGDVTVTAYGLTLLANIIQVDITPAAELDAEQSRTARAYQAQIAYQEPFFGLQPAYRFAYYDPNVDADATISPAFEALTYHTIGLNYNAPTYPVRVMLNYTITGEEDLPIDNDRFDALVQLAW
jgi:hypothetical protein